MSPRWTLAATLALASLATPALSQTKKAEIEAAKKAAVALADKGVEAFRAEKYEEAIDTFKKADQKFHVPKFLLYVARSQVKLGKLLAAKATYQSILDEKLPPYAPEEFFTAQTDAKKELVEVENKIPTIRIEVNGAPAGQAPAVTLDGEKLPSSDLGRPLARDPGPHAIVVTAPGRPQVNRTVHLREGGSESVILEMGVTAPPTSTDGGASTSAPPDGTGTGDAPPDGAGAASGGIPTFTYVAWGVGAAGLIAGGVMGGLALGKYNEYNASPTRDALDQGKLFSLVADIGFGTAVAGAAAGTIYWLVTRKSGGDPAKGGLFIAPAVGAGSGGAVVLGRF